MLHSRISLWERVAPVLLASFLAALPAAAQRSSSGASTAGAPSTGSTPGTGTPGTIGRGNTGNIPGNNYPNSPSTTIQRPIFLSGKAMFDDGSKPTMDIRIERVCSGSPHLEGHTDSKGRFSFQVRSEERRVGKECRSRLER